MSGFADFTVSWDGRDYRIPASRILRAVAMVEEHITFLELGQYASQNKLPIAKLSSGFAALLQLAGAAVTTEEVYSWMMQNGARTNAVACLGLLLDMMIPPDMVRKAMETRQAEAAESMANPPLPEANMPSSVSCINPLSEAVSCALPSSGG
jgi:hypothetical protein